MDDERISQAEMRRLTDDMPVSQLAALAAYALMLVAARKRAGHAKNGVPVVR